MNIIPVNLNANALLCECEPERGVALGFHIKVCYIIFNTINTAYFSGVGSIILVGEHQFVGDNNYACML